MSEPEVMLWSRLRGRGADKPTFRRQHPIGPFILDFFCPQARLAVEIDGATHWDEAAQAKDAARDRWLAKQAITVVRIPASHIFADLNAVADGVILQAMALIASTSPAKRREGDHRPTLAKRAGEPMVEGASRSQGLADHPATPRARPAPSTARSSACGPPPAASRGR